MLKVLGLLLLALCVLIAVPTFVIKSFMLFHDGLMTFWGLFVVLIAANVILYLMNYLLEGATNGTES